jgi:hypothetical protein
MALTVIKPSGIDTSGNYTVTGMNVSANLSAANLSVTTSANLGAVGNIIITGGTNGYVLQTDGSGTLSWVAQAGGGIISNISNGNSNVNIPAANGNINLTAVGNTTMVVTGNGVNVAGYATVTGNLSAGNITTGAGSGGNISGANVISANIVTATISANLGNSVTANFFIGSGANLTSIPAGNISGQVANALIASTVYTNDQPNITSTGTLVNLTVSGNVVLSGANVSLGAVGNLKITGGTANYVLQTDGTGNLSWVAQSGGGNISNISNGNSNVNIPSSNGNVNISAVGVANIVVITGTGLNVTGTANVSGNLSVGNITTGAGSGGNISGANVISANIVTATISANLGNSVTANFFIGSGANLTSIPAGNISGQVANALVASTVYTNAQPNITSVGTLTSLSVTGNISSGNANLGNAATANFFIGNGSLLTGISASFPIANGNSNIAVPTANGNVNISSAGNANIVVVTGTGLNVTGTANVSGNLSVGNITTGAGTGGNISGANVISANIINASDSANLGNSVTANFFIGSGANLTSIPASNISGQVANALVAGTVYTAAQPNITSVGTLTSLIVTGNISSGNANLGNAATANFFVGNGSLLTGVSASFPIANGNSNISVPTANGNVNISAVGNANVLVITGTGANITGTANVTGNLTAGNIIAGTGSGGNITNANVISANTFTATGNITASNANLGNTVTANYFIGNFYGTANSATTAGTVTTAAQPNITSVGTLTGITSTGTVNLTGASNVALGPVANVHITGGSNGQYLQTDGSGTLTWSTVSSGSTSNISNGNSNVNIPAANGNVNISAVGNANILVITGTGANITGTANITGNLTAGNIIAGSGSGGNISNANVVSANTFIATGNITAGNANLGNLTTSNYFAGTLTTAAQPNITSVGTLTSLAVTGNISSGNANLGNAVTANFFIGSGANLTSLPAGNISGQVANALVAGTVYTNAQPNITSVGTLASANVTGNIVSNANVVTDLIVGRTSGITITATGTNQNINLTPTGTGTVNVGNFIISNVLTPVASTDAATKQYVDDVAQGLNIHDSVQAATPDTLANITVGTITYNNGTAGVGANLTTTGTFNLIDGVNVQTSGTRILVKNEANAVLNGIYTWSNATVITRATDYNSVPEVEAGDFVFVTGGTIYDNTGWVQTSTVTAIGTAGNNIDFVQFSGAGTYTAGTGLTLTGSVFSISNTTVTAGSYGNGDTVATFTVNGQGQLTAAANTVITANAANLTGTTLNSTVVNSSLTSVGSLTGLTVSNATGIVNFTTTANVTLGAVANLHISGGTNAYVLQTDGTGNLSWVAQSAGGAISNISNGNSNVNIPTVNGNINLTSVGNTTMVITGTGANISGYATVTGNVTLSGANVSLGNVSNLHITGGTNAYVLSTDGAGNLSWAQASGTSIGVDNFTGNGVATAYTLSTTPANANATLVSIAGTFQPRTVYSLAGNVITFSSAPPNTAPIEVTTFTTAGGGGGGGGITAQDLLSPFLLMGA